MTRRSVHEIAVNLLPQHDAQFAHTFSIEELKPSSAALHFCPCGVEPKRE
jgi:hypothetical protein